MIAIFFTWPYFHPNLLCQYKIMLTYWSWAQNWRNFEDFSLDWKQWNGQKRWIWDQGRREKCDHYLSWNLLLSYHTSAPHHKITGAEWLNKPWDAGRKGYKPGGTVTGHGAIWGVGGGQPFPSWPLPPWGTWRTLLRAGNTGVCVKHGWGVDSLWQLYLNVYSDIRRIAKFLYFLNQN